MNFELDADQRALSDTVQRYLAREYGFERRRAIRDSSDGWSREAWQSLADLGVLAINIDEDHGGLGYGPVETGLVMAGFGAGLLLEPYLPAAVIAPALIRRATSADFQNEWLPRIAGGEAIVMPALNDARGQEVKHHDGRLSGRKSVVSHAGSASLLLVSARCDDGSTGLFALEPDAPGVEVIGYPTLDGQRAANVGLADAPARQVGAGATAIDEALDIGLSALCSEAVGIMDATVSATTEYLRTRRQFGQPIGRFQALQHRMADMLLHLEQARSMAYLAALRCTLPDGAERKRLLSAAKVTIGQAARFIAQNALQLHGGMGMTDELVLSHWFKRLTAIELSFGSTDYHLQRFAGLSRAA